MAISATQTNGLDARRSKLAFARQPGCRVVAVTGGAGFIGAHLCEYLIARGDRVICLDNFHTGQRTNIAALFETPRFEMLHHDITEPLPQSLPVFDQIYNLACPASPVHYQSDRVRTALVCAQGALHVLERAAQDNARVLQASTSEIYGDPEMHPQVEGYFGNVNTVGPRSCYDEGKRFAETLFTDFGAQTDTEVRIARIFNTYGPRMQPKDGRVVSNFIVQALNGEPITIQGDGNQTRSFCYVDDLVDGLVRLMDTDGVSGPFNLGNPAEMTVSELANLVIKLTSSSSTVTFKQLPQDDPRRRRPDIGRACKHLRWSPSTSLEEGLVRTIRFFAHGEIRTPQWRAELSA